MSKLLEFRVGDIVTAKAHPGLWLVLFAGQHADGHNILTVEAVDDPRKQFFDSMQNFSRLHPVPCSANPGPLLRLNEYVVLTKDVLLEHRGRQGRVLELKGEEARLTFDDGSSGWFFLQHMLPVEARPSVNAEPVRGDQQHPGELETLRVLGDAVLELIAANDESRGLDRPRPDIAWRNVKRAHEAWAKTLLGVAHRPETARPAVAEPPPVHAYCTYRRAMHKAFPDEYPEDFEPWPALAQEERDAWSAVAEALEKGTAT